MAWFDPLWSNRKKITVDNTKVPGTSHTSFPVLISITDADIKATAQADGDDILFTSADGTTKLDHEIEKWDNVTGILVAWVRIPTLSGTVDTDIYVYYGNPAATDQQNITGVWDSNYKAIWHLPESAGSALDSTSNNHDGTFNGDLPDSVAVKIANGQDLDGTGDDISVASHADFNLFNNDWCVSLWFDQAADAGTGQYAYISIGSNNNNILTAYVDNKRLFVTIRTGASTVVSIRADATPGDWNPSAGAHHMRISRDGNDYYLYIDNVQTNTVNDTDQVANASQPVNIGLYAGIGYRYTGKLDETRVTKGIARSVDWFTTEYNNQNVPATFYSVGAEETPGTTLNRISGVLDRTASGVLVRVVA